MDTPGNAISGRLFQLLESSFWAIAAAGIGLSSCTGNYIWDGIATIAIGLLLGIVGILLVYKSMGLLVGRSISQTDWLGILRLLKTDRTVSKVFDLKSTILGAKDFRFKAEIDFNGRELARQQIAELNLDDEYRKLKSKNELEVYLEKFGENIIDRLGLEIDRIEKVIRKEYPEAKHIDLETH